MPHDMIIILYDLSLSYNFLNLLFKCFESLIDMLHYYELYNIYVCGILHYENIHMYFKMSNILKLFD